MLHLIFSLLKRVKCRQKLSELQIKKAVKNRLPFLTLEYRDQYPGFCCSLMLGLASSSACGIGKMRRKLEVSRTRGTLPG